MKNIFLLLGGNKLNYGIFKKFQEKGFEIYVVDWNTTPDLKGDLHYQIDVKDSDAILKRLNNDKILTRVKFVYTSIDLAVKSVAEINRAIGLKTISDNGILYASSKSQMTMRWNELGLLNRFSKSYKQFEEEIIDLNHRFKLIIKPDNSSSSRGITICDKNTYVEIIKIAFEKAKNEATDSLVVVEEYVDGIEFTVEMLGDDYGNVSVYAVSQKTHTKNTDNNKIAIKLHYNSNRILLQKKIAEYGIKCYKALGFTNSFGHLEVLLKGNGIISPVEIGARSSGFIASDLVDIVSGKDYISDLMAVQNGAIITNGLVEQTNFSSMYFFYDIQEGNDIVNETNLLNFTDKCIVSRYSDRLKLKKGTRFTKINDDNSRQGYEILEGPKSIMTLQHIIDAEQKMLNQMMGV